jgi:hypothetical protein
MRTFKFAIAALLTLAFAAPSFAGIRREHHNNRCRHGHCKKSDVVVTVPDKKAKPAPAPSVPVVPAPKAGK